MSSGFRQLKGAMVLSVALLLAIAHACLNDTHSQAAEDEFRSQYDKPAKTAPAEAGMNVPGMLALAAGSALVGGCIVIGVQRARNEHERA